MGADPAGVQVQVGELTSPDAEMPLLRVAWGGAACWELLGPLLAGPQQILALLLAVQLAPPGPLPRASPLGFEASCQPRSMGLAGAASSRLRKRQIEASLHLQAFARPLLVLCVHVGQGPVYTRAVAALGDPVAIV